LFTFPKGEKFQTVRSLSVGPIDTVTDRGFVLKL